MKYLFTFLVAVLSCLALASAAKSDECLEPMAKDGNGVFRCMGFMPSWTYDAEADKCVEFVYGGCHGNANRFPTEEICRTTCIQ